MSGEGRWRQRARTAEAALALIISRILVAKVGFARWRGLLGERLPPDDRARRPAPGAVPALAYQSARAVERATLRLAGEYKCLPRAMALHAMLHRREISSVLRIGALAGANRGSLDDLHAWVTVGGVILIGHTDLTYGELAAFGDARANH